MHGDMSQFGGLGEILISKGCIELLDKSQHFVESTIRTIIGEKSDVLSSLLEFLQLVRPLPSSIGLAVAFPLGR